MVSNIEIIPFRNLPEENEDLRIVIEEMRKEINALRQRFDGMFTLYENVSFPVVEYRRFAHSLGRPAKGTLVLNRNVAGSNLIADTQRGDIRKELWLKSTGTNQEFTFLIY